MARFVCGARKATSHNAISEELGLESLKSCRLATKDKHFTKNCNKSAPQYLCELLPTTVGEHSQRSLRNENDLKEMKGRTETFRGSFIPDAVKRYNNNLKCSGLLNYSFWQLKFSLFTRKLKNTKIHCQQLAQSTRIFTRQISSLNFTSSKCIKYNLYTFSICIKINHNNLCF